MLIIKAKITATKLTDVNLLREACSATTGKPSKMTLDKAYRCEHSPMRTQLFWIEMQDIPTFVSVHFVRHKIGVEHFVRTNRSDLTGSTETVDRNTPVTHCMLLNAETLITMARKRLCDKASTETQQVMDLVRKAVEMVDPDLKNYMVPNCCYRGECFEGRDKRRCGSHNIYAR